MWKRYLYWLGVAFGAVISGALLAASFMWPTGF